MQEYVHKDLFTGIAGFTVAMRMVLGQRHVPRLFCENDPVRQEWLRRNYLGVPIAPDIQTLEADDATTDITTAGFPCQPVSVAGQRRGARDDRYLWPALYDFIVRDKPRWFVGENVAGLASMGEPIGAARLEDKAIMRDAKRDIYQAVLSQQEEMLLERICQDLEEAGYNVVPFLIPACAVGAPHERGRVWIVADAYRVREPQLQGSEQNERRWPCDRITETGAETASHAVGHGLQAKRIAAGGGKVAQARVFTDAYPSDRGNGRLYAHCPGLPTGAHWAIEPPVGRMVHGVPNRVDRIKALGNAIVPQVAAQIITHIVAVDALLGLKP
uniref:DNA (cytosine-5-)-methyltransferase n=1 Tax=Candidatus Kentrum sp. UNK TaxID=2126344 RepID=A0A451AQN2_9GAMM|nr:MAG: C-5 cytosine-specific DNA methylase [Candidatus Kentron sp. UNK]VFK68333.1 MAG: C-5 cytosine-specific DNA methylase [Candidatus Kentron sp. UNK]